MFGKLCAVMHHATKPAENMAGVRGVGLQNAGVSHKGRLCKRASCNEACSEKLVCVKRNGSNCLTKTVPGSETVVRRWLVCRALACTNLTNKSSRNATVRKRWSLCEEQWHEQFGKKPTKKHRREMDGKRTSGGSTAGKTEPPHLKKTPGPQCSAHKPSFCDNFVEALLVKPFKPT